MPMYSKSEVKRPTRRSSRLNERSKGVEKTDLQLDGPGPMKRRKVAAIQDSLLVGSSQRCPTDMAKVLTEPRRSNRTSSQLLMREQELARKEEELRKRSDELDARSLLALEQEKEVALMLSQVQDREAKLALAQLEEHFTCALCYEIMAHPFTLNPGVCGHTFCAVCILKWFFSRLHKACGGWHESVDCPICRSLLVITPDRTPRLDITFPFVPNRIAATVCESQVEKLASLFSGSKVKREASEGLSLQLGRSRKKGKSKQETEAEAEASDLAAWREGGPMRLEWLKKDREGKKEMNYLLTHWTTMRSQDFIMMKQKLGV